MEWKVANSLPAHTFSQSLGVFAGDCYHVNDNCLLNLENILNKLCSEDRTVRTFRKALGFVQVIKKDLIPLLINVKNDHNITAATIRILFNLTIPVECLLPIEEMSKTETGLNTISELNNILSAGKEAFLEPRSTKAVVEYIKQVLERDVNGLPAEECENVNNCLLLIRNILHTPETRSYNTNAQHVNVNINNNAMQKQIIWNLFAQGIDKILINLMTCSQKSYWGVTMVQLIALMYKDQHVSSMKKLLNMWFEASISESSEDNESNTSPPDQGSGDSSPLLTSDPTSDSSDTGSSSKNNRMLTHCVSMMEIDTSSKQHLARHHPHSEASKAGGKISTDSQRKCPPSGSASRRGSLCKSSSSKSDVDSGICSQRSSFDSPSTPPGTSHCLPEAHESGKRGYPSSSETSDCGYATQHENQEQSMSTSSNEDEGPLGNRGMKPVHQKPPNMQKTRYTSKPNVLLQDKKELRKRKLAKRSRATNFSINMKALIHYTPSDEDISNLLKEFTVEFLLKGYGTLVQELHNQLLRNDQRAQIDTSHFFWLVTYFLKFAAQLELELELIKPVLSFEIVSYLTYEGVNLFEQLEIASQQGRAGLRPCLRRMHLVITAIRELIQAIETYKKISHLSSEDREHLLQLQLQIGSTEDLKCLFVLLLQQYNPNFQSKQYLQDLIITNHMLLLCLDSVSKLPEFKGTINMVEHIKQFATVEVISQYGLLLEDFQENGEYINNCVFTMMHHVSGDLEEPAVLFQPSILKTFSEIWEMDFEICDDWSDLIEYVMHKFINILRPSSLLPQVAVGTLQANELEAEPFNLSARTSEGKWPIECCSDLPWYYTKSTMSSDPIGLIKKLYAENGTMSLSRIMIIEQLFTQHVIDFEEYENLKRMEDLNSTMIPQTNFDAEQRNCQTFDDISKSLPTSQSNIFENNLHEISTSSFETMNTLRDLVIKEKKIKAINWLQHSILEACYVKLKLNDNFLQATPSDFVMEPIALHYTLMKQSIPLVPWNSEQKSLMKHQPFILLLHKLGFHLPEDSGKIFARIPHFWTADVLLEVAEKLGPISTDSWKKFDTSLVPRRKENVMKDVHAMDTSTQYSEFAVQRSHPPSSMIRFTPLPNSSPTWMQFATELENSAEITETARLPPISLRSKPPRVTVTVEVRTDKDRVCSGRDAGIPLSSTIHVIGNKPDDMDRLTVCNVCETGHGSVSSDLTHMCISDEEMGLNSGDFHSVNNTMDLT